MAQQKGVRLSEIQQVLNKEFFKIDKKETRTLLYTLKFKVDKYDSNMQNLSQSQIVREKRYDWIDILYAMRSYLKRQDIKLIKHIEENVEETPIEELRQRIKRKIYIKKIPIKLYFFQ